MIWKHLYSLETDGRCGGLTDESALLESYILRVHLICKQLQVLGKTLEAFDQRIAAAFKEHEDRDIFASFPGASPVLAPRLLASMGSERERFASNRNLQAFSGIAPVTKRKRPADHSSGHPPLWSAGRLLLKHLRQIPPARNFFYMHSDVIRMLIGAMRLIGRWTSATLFPKRSP